MKFTYGSDYYIIEKSHLTFRACMCVPGDLLFSPHAPCAPSEFRHE